MIMNKDECIATTILIVGIMIDVFFFIRIPDKSIIDVFGLAMQIITLVVFAYLIIWPDHSTKKARLLSTRPGGKENDHATRIHPS
jgi:hypothetical protein